MYLRTTAFKILALLALLIPFLLPARPAAAGSASPDLFGPGGNSLGPAQTRAGESRSRTASLDLAQVEQARTQLGAGQAVGGITFNLFPDASLAAHFQSARAFAGGGYSLAGKVDGDPLSEVHLAVVGQAVYASIHSAQGTYAVEGQAGSVRISQLDPASFFEEADPLTPPSTGPAMPAGAASAVPAVGPSTVDDGSRIDVLVAYTTADMNLHGGTPAAMLAFIQTAISETNAGYANSGVSQRVVLADAVQVNYDETHTQLQAGDTTWWVNTLNRLSTPGDLVFGVVNARRDQVAADEVVLLISNAYESICGMAWQMTSVSPAFASAAFAVVAGINGCATGYYSFGHEMGHNMGANHDVRNAGGSPGAYTFSYGFWILNPVTSHYDWRTVMAYNTASTYGYDSTRIDYWSNPAILYNGQPTGSTSANNALTLNNTAGTVAGFRDGPSPAAPGNLTESPLSSSSVQLNWVDNSNDELRFRIERSPAASISWAEIGQVGPNVTTFTDNGFTPPLSNYQYRVLSDNGDGRTVSNTANLLPPAPPGNLAAQGLSDIAVQLNWADNSDNETGFQIERAPANSSAWAQVGQVGMNVVTYTDGSIPAAGDYQYRVLADNGGLTAPSGVVIVPAKPGAPAAHADISTNHSVNLDWTDASSVETGYRIARSTDGGANWTQLALQPANTTHFLDSGAACGRLNTYRISANNGTGNSAYAIASSTPPPCTPLLTAATAMTNVVFSWQAVTGASSYILQLWNAGANQYFPVPPTAILGPTRWLVDGLTAGASYQFRLVAQDGSGQKSPSDPLTIQMKTSQVLLPLILR